MIDAFNSDEMKRMNEGQMNKSERLTSILTNRRTMNEGNNEIISDPCENNFIDNDIGRNFITNQYFGKGRR